MNPFQRLASRFVNWWRGAPQDTGGARTLNSQSFLESLGLRRKRKPTSECYSLVYLNQNPQFFSKFNQR